MRRAIAVGAAVTTIAVAAIVVGWLLGHDDGGHDPIEVDTEWNVVATVDPATGGVTIVDPDNGEVADEIVTDVGRVRDSALVDSTLVVVGSRGEVGIDLGDGTPVDLDPDETLSGTVTLARPSGTDRTILLAGDSGNAVIVNGDPDGSVATSDLIDLAGVRLDAGSALATTDGTAVLLPDVGNFQSVLVAIGNDEPTYFPGAPLALDDDRVATVLNVGAEARVTISTHDGETEFEVATDPIAGAMLADDGLLTVSTDGTVARIVDGESAQVGTLGGIPVQRQTWAMISGDRLVVTTDAGTDVLDPSGEVVISLVGVSPLLTGDDEPWSPGIHHALCLATTTTDGVMLVDAREGRRSTSIPEGDLLVRADGCAGVVATDGANVALAVDPDVTAADELDGDPLSLAPDGATVATALDGSVQLAPALTTDDADDEPTPPVTVAEGDTTVYFGRT